MAPTCESIRSQIRPSAPISRSRQAISRITRAPLRTGARFSSSARSSSAAVAAALASASAALIAASASASRVIGRPAVFWAAMRLLDPRHRVEHHAGVGVAVALGIFAEKPAAPRGLHEGFADRVVILLARLGRARGDRGQGECFVGHGKLIAQIIARYANDHHDIERIAIELMPARITNPHRICDGAEAIRGAAWRCFTARCSP